MVTDPTALRRLVGVLDDNTAIADFIPRIKQLTRMHGTSLRLASTPNMRTGIYTEGVSCFCHRCDKLAQQDFRKFFPREMYPARFIVCEHCGNKRCPHATDHDLSCTQSNESGQPGSLWENIQP